MQKGVDLFLSPPPPLFSVTRLAAGNSARGLNFCVPSECFSSI